MSRKVRLSPSDELALALLSSDIPWQRTDDGSDSHLCHGTQVGGVQCSVRIRHTTAQRERSAPWRVIVQLDSSGSIICDCVFAEVADALNHAEAHLLVLRCKA